MQIEISKIERIERRMLDAVKSCQTGVLDTFELELGDSPNWRNIRGRLLRCFGDRGLAANIIEILGDELDLRSNDLRKHP